MLIFIDESGNFTIPPARKRNLSCVGALIVPETVHNDLMGAFVKLRDKWEVGRFPTRGKREYSKGRANSGGNRASA